MHLILFLTVVSFPAFAIDASTEHQPDQGSSILPPTTTHVAPAIATVPNPLHEPAAGVGGTVSLDAEPLSAQRVPNVTLPTNQVHQSTGQQEPDEETGRDSFALNIDSRNSLQRQGPTSTASEPDSLLVPATATAHQSNKSDVTFPPHRHIITYKKGVLCLSQVLQPVTKVAYGCGFITAAVGLSTNSLGVLDPQTANIFTTMVRLGGVSYLLFKNLCSLFERKVNEEEGWLVKVHTLKQHRAEHPEYLLEEPDVGTGHYAHPQILPGPYMRGFYLFLLSTAQIVETTGDLLSPILKYMALSSYLDAGTEAEAIQFTIDPRQNPYAKIALGFLAGSLVAEQLSKRSTSLIKKWQAYLLVCEKLEARIKHQRLLQSLNHGDGDIESLDTAIEILPRTRAPAESLAPPVTQMASTPPTNTAQPIGLSQRFWAMLGYPPHRS